MGYHGNPAVRRTCSCSPVPLTRDQLRPELHAEQYNSYLFLCVALSSAVCQVSCNECETLMVSICYMVLCSSGHSTCISSLTMFCSWDQLHLADRRLWPCAAAGKHSTSLSLHKGNTTQKCASHLCPVGVMCLDFVQLGSIGCMSCYIPKWAVSNVEEK